MAEPGHDRSQRLQNMHLLISHWTLPLFPAGNWTCTIGYLVVSGRLKRFFNDLESIDKCGHLSVQHMHGSTEIVITGTSAS